MNVRDSFVYIPLSTLKPQLYSSNRWMFEIPLYTFHRAPFNPNSVYSSNRWMFEIPSYTFHWAPLNPNFILLTDECSKFLRTFHWAPLNPNFIRLNLPFYRLMNQFGIFQVTWVVRLDSFLAPVSWHSSSIWTCVLWCFLPSTNTAINDC